MYKRKWSYEVICGTIYPFLLFPPHITFNNFYKLSFLNGQSYKFLVDLVQKVSISWFYTSYNFLILYRRKRSYVVLCGTIYPFFIFQAPITCTNFYERSFLNGQSYTFLVGPIQKVAISCFYNSYNFLNSYRWKPHINLYSYIIVVVSQFSYN